MTLTSLARLCEWVETALIVGDRDGTLGPRRTEEQVCVDRELRLWSWLSV